MKIVQVKNKSELREFIKIPWKIYEGNPYWVPPLIKEQERILTPVNPFFKHADVELFMAKDNSNPIGRIAAIIDYNYQDYYQEKAGAFGFFESIDDYEVAQALFDQVFEWLKTKKVEMIMGPLNPSTNEECGLLVEGFERSPFIMMPYNHSYYPHLMEKYGFEKERDLLAYEVILNRDYGSKWLALSEKFKKKAVKIRSINLKKLKREIEIIRDIYNSAWSENWGFVPMTDEEIHWMGRRLKPLAEPELILIAEIEGFPAGFVMALPNYNNLLKKLNGTINPISAMKLLWNSRKIKEVRFVTLGIKGGYRRNRYLLPIFSEFIKNAIAKGYQLAEISWILEDNLNPQNAIIKHLGGKISKKYRIYGMRL
ncbi:MAG: hypothetical protein AMJ42_02875 [Deltaproteobacteria bacterium DG_8]|nr:MAG: hypothetical protein AMJ42_02875 [Deltaproteobacteria bacterium DG_8]